MALGQEWSGNSGANAVKMLWQMFGLEYDHSYSAIVRSVLPMPLPGQVLRFCHVALPGCGNETQVSRVFQDVQHGDYFDLRLQTEIEIIKRSPVTNERAPFRDGWRGVFADYDWSCGPVFDWSKSPGQKDLTSVGYIGEGTEIKVVSYRTLDSYYQR